MGRAFLFGVAALAFAACQPMYGSKPEKMRSPIRGTPVPTEEIAAKPVYIEDCPVDFQRPPPKAGVKRNERGAATLVDRGDTTIAAVDLPENVNERGSLLRASIDRYSGALVQDPYNADATLKLALAYDRVHRKGCALALLKRLVALAGNRIYEPAATADINRVDDNKQWFRDYRAEALKAIGH